MRKLIKEEIQPIIQEAIELGDYEYIAKNAIRIYALINDPTVKAESYIIEISWTKK